MHNDTCHSLSKAGERNVFISFLSAVFLAYIGCVVVAYAYSDDYGQILYLHEGWVDWKTNFLNRDGRLITSILLSTSFKAVRDIDALSILRAVSLVSVLLFAGHFFRTLVKLGAGTWSALAISSIALFAPGIGEYIGWTACWPYTIALAFTSWLGATFAWQVAEASMRKTIIVSIVSCAALELVMLTYQPVAGFFIIAPFLWITLKKRLRPAFVGCIVLAATFALYRFLIFPGLNAVNDSWCTMARAGIENDLLGHLGYVVTQFLPTVASGWGKLLFSVEGFFPIGCLVLAASAAGFVCAAARFNGRRAIYAAILAGAAFSLTSPQVFLMGDISAFRIHFPMTVMIGILAWEAIRTLCAAKVVAVASRTLALVIFLCAAWCVNLGIVYPSAREYRIIQSSLMTLKQSGEMRAVVLTPPQIADFQQPVPLHYNSAYATIGLTMMGDFEIRAVQREVWPDYTKRPELTFIRADMTKDIPKDGTVVLDLWGEITGKPTPLPAARVLP